MGKMQAESAGARCSPRGALPARLLLTGLGLVLVSCSPSKLAQCQEMAGVIESAHNFKGEYDAEMDSLMTTVTQTESLDDVKSAANQYMATVDKVAANITDLNESLDALDFADEQVAAYRDQYVEIMQDTRQEFDAAGQAMALVAQAETPDAVRDNLEDVQTQVSNTYSNIQALSTEEAMLVNEINQYCTAASTPIAE
ncbi:hypothetical protein IQ241_24215 [Romeria aff. gracilis LEGE 07310]|uniref:Uncharacterized protein n=1 Tax=Vasconcelosia minhoensis LEGE 07310 TaxID=915328 RepID=A0A8J7ATM5_9CYAN|nr:hypothetical protein [Romeria gracilis]MBE9080355.1 hypothetical protein [Romeria aff. gracilis LEGE 07310]